MHPSLVHQAPNYLDASQGPLLLQIRGGLRNGEVVPFHSAKCTVGTSARCTHRILARGVQPLHCLIVRGSAATVIRSYSPATWLNGQRFGDAVLRPGDRLTVGPVEFQVVCLRAVNNEVPPPEGTIARIRHDRCPPARPLSSDGSMGGSCESRQLPDTCAEAADTAFAETETEVANRAAELDARKRELDSQAGELARREALLESFLREAESRHKSIDARQAELDKRQAELDERQAQLDKRQAELDAQGSRLEHWQAELQTRGTHISGQEADLDRRRADLERRQAALDRRQADLDRQQSELEAQWAEWDQRKVEAEARQRALDARHTALDRRESELDTRHEELSRAERVLRDRQQQIEDRLTELEQRQAALARPEAWPSGETYPLPPVAVPAQFPSAEFPEEPGAALSTPRVLRQTEFGEPAGEAGVWPLSVLSANEPGSASNAPVDTETMFRRLGIRPPADDEAEPTLPARAAATNPPTTREKRVPAHTEEESIDSYMARLLERLRGASGQGQAANAEAEQGVSARQASAEMLSNAGEETGAYCGTSWQDSQEPGDNPRFPRSRRARPMPKSAPPEDWSHLAAMRELANLSARNALDRHGQNMLRRAIRGKLAVMVLAFLAGSTLLVLWWRFGGDEFAYRAGLLCYLVAIIWAIQYAILTGRLMVSRSGHLGWRFSARPASPINDAAQSSGPTHDPGALPAEAPSLPEEPARPDVNPS